MKPVIITVFDSETRTSTDYTFESSPIRIGRNPLNDLALPFPFVSGWHAVVRFDENLPRFYDLGSTNGTLFDGRRIQPGEPLDVGEMLSVTIGRLELQLRRGTAVQPSSGTQPQLMERPPPAAFVPTQVSATQAQPSGHVGLAQHPTSDLPAAGAPPAELLRQAAMAGTHAQHPGLNPTGAFPSALTPSVGGMTDAGRPPVRGGEDGTAHVQMGAVHKAIANARPRYDMLKQSAAHLVAEIAAALHSMSPALQLLAIPLLAREFPELPGLPEFQALAARVGAPLPSIASGGGGGAMLGLVRRLSEQVRPEEEAPKSPEETERFFACMADVLMAGASALIELQKGQEQFGNEMGVRVIKEFTPLHAAGTPDNLLRYLLDWNKGGSHRTQELRGVYADLMIHQVALIRGIVEGARSLIARLDPREIERGLASAWPSKNAAAWKAYEQLWQELATNDRKITELVFGPDFARGYAEVGGEG